MLTLFRCTVVGIVLGIVSGNDIRIYRSIRCAIWASWSSGSTSRCNVDCGTGEMTEKRKRICRRVDHFFPPSPHGCNYAEVETTTMACDTQVACTGTPGPWGSWTPVGVCDYCLSRRQTFTRTRSCSVGTLCEGGVRQTREFSCNRRFPLYLCSYCRPSSAVIFTSTPPVFTACIFGSFQRIRCPDSSGDLYRTCGNVKTNPICRIFNTIEHLCMFRRG